MAYGMGSVTGGGQEYPVVDTFDDLPPADEFPKRIYLVVFPTGTWPINRKRAGLYRSDGINWSRMGIVPTIEELGGDPAGTAVAAVNAHNMQADPHLQYVKSASPSGMCRVEAMYVDPETNKTIIEYDDEPIP